MKSFSYLRLFFLSAFLSIFPNPKKPEESQSEALNWCRKYLFEDTRPELSTNFKAFFTKHYQQFPNWSISVVFFESGAMETKLIFKKRDTIYTVFLKESFNSLEGLKQNIKKYEKVLRAMF